MVSGWGVAFSRILCVFKVVRRGDAVTFVAAFHHLTHVASQRWCVFQPVQFPTIKSGVAFRRGCNF